MKINTSELSFSILTEKADLHLFKCHDEELEDYLLNDALKDQNNRLSVTRLVYSQEQLVGYFTLVNSAIRSSWVNNDIGLVEYQYSYYPSIKIARLATNIEYERLGIGKAMLQRTIAVALNLSNYIGCRFIGVDAKKESVLFYLKYGFRIPGSFAKELKEKEVIPLYKDLNSR